jgi:hypothetical protein
MLVEKQSRNISIRRVAFQRLVLIMLALKTFREGSENHNIAMEMPMRILRTSRPMLTVGGWSCMATPGSCLQAHCWKQ